MEGKSQKASGSVSTPKSTGSSRPAQREGERSGVVLTNTKPDVSENSGPSTITLSRAAFEKMLRILKPDVDPALILAQIESDPAPPTTVQQSSQPLHAEVHPTYIKEGGGEWQENLGESGLPADDTKVPEPYSGNTMEAEEVERLERGKEVEQQSHATGKSTNMSEVERVDVDHATQEIEKSTTMEVEENPDIEENPTERMETDRIEDVETCTKVPEKGEVVILTDGEEEAEKVPSSSETIEPDTAAVHTY